MSTLSRRAFGGLVTAASVSFAAACAGGTARPMRTSADTGVGHARPDVLQVSRARDIVGRPLVAGILGEPVAPVARDADAEFADFLVRDNQHREP